MKSDEQNFVEMIRLLQIYEKMKHTKTMMPDFYHWPMHYLKLQMAEYMEDLYESLPNKWVKYVENELYQILKP